jgi:2-iminobutanoate/2-iminopropanoate deaminase
MITPTPSALYPFWAPIRSQSLPAPHFSYTPVVRAGGCVFVSGLVALDPVLGTLINDGMEAQTRQILNNFERLSAELELGLDQLMLARIYCADFAQFSAINQVWEEFFSERIPPARTSVGVSALPLGALVEIEFQFAIDPLKP